jgi:hypothetical protein
VGLIHKLSLDTWFACPCWRVLRRGLGSPAEAPLNQPLIHHLMDGAHHGLNNTKNFDFNDASARFSPEHSHEWVDSFGVAHGVDQRWHGILNEMMYGDGWCRFRGKLVKVTTDTGSGCGSRAGSDSGCLTAVLAFILQHRFAADRALTKIPAHQRALEIATGVHDSDFHRDGVCPTGIDPNIFQTIQHQPTLNASSSSQHSSRASIMMRVGICVARNGPTRSLSSCKVSDSRPTLRFAFRTGKNPVGSPSIGERAGKLG